VELNGKTAVITGGASGIGFATAERFAASGMNLVLGDIEAGPLEAAVATLSERGAKVIGVNCDVAKEEDVFAMRDAALSEFGGVHVVFNNAGVGAGPAIGTPKRVWDWVMAVNVDGVINGINAFMPILLEQDEGHMISTASLAGLGGVPGMGPYCASKFAVVGICETLYHELRLRQSNVGVSCLCPGFVNTRIFESHRNMPSELRGDMNTPDAQATASIAQSAVSHGIDASIVGEAVENAVREKRFWILTHEHSAIRTTEQRVAWMQGGGSTKIDLERATKG
jgi:NAD(P)-dependent dehydrogenase (short-subunit alcohol dehydrogenase family)